MKSYDLKPYYQVVFSFPHIYSKDERFEIERFNHARTSLFQRFKLSVPSVYLNTLKHFDEHEIKLATVQQNDKSTEKGVFIFNIRLGDDTDIKEFSQKFELLIAYAHGKHVQEKALIEIYEVKLSKELIE